MPATLTYPGVYIEEVASGVRTITGVATSITAFVGRARFGPVNEPVTVNNYGDFERNFGGLWTETMLGFEVRDFFLNGGGQAVIVRLQRTGAKATLELQSATDPLVLEAANEGEWGNTITAFVDHETKDPADTKLFNLTLRDLTSADGTSGRTEVYRNVSTDPANARYVANVLAGASAIARVHKTGDVFDVPADQPDETDPLTGVTAAGGDDGDPLTTDQFVGAGNDLTSKTGLYALERVDLFNLLCIPPFEEAAEGLDVADDVVAAATAYCEARRAILLLDAPSTWLAKQDAKDGMNALTDRHKNVAQFFPRLLERNPLRDYQVEVMPAAGAVAGVFARTDAQRGVWKAPAGIEAIVRGTVGFSVPLTDAEVGELNPLGLNCLRTFPVYGSVVWGARTRRGADMLADEWKYVPVRRTALFIEESLYRGTKWVVFEPSSEPLWAQIRLNIGAFMHNLFRQGAFKGTSPKEAYFVKCDKETTTQNDINLGIVNIHVGFAPLKPAEFVVIKIQQIAGEIET